MKLLAVICQEHDVDNTISWLKNETGVYVVKATALNEYLRNITYTPNSFMIIFRIMDQETELMLRLKYPVDTFLTVLES